MKFSTVLTIIFFFEVLIIGQFIAEETYDRTISSLIQSGAEYAFEFMQSEISKAIQSLEEQTKALTSINWLKTL